MPRTIHSGDILLGLEDQDTNLIYHREADGSLTFVRYSNQAFCDNLRYIDTQMPELLAYLLPWINTYRCTSFEKVAKYLEQTNPYHLPDDIAHRLYPHRLATLAAHAAMGLPLTPKWNGRYQESFLQIQSSGKTQSYACIQLSDLHILFPSCKFYSKMEESDKEVRLKVIVKYEEQENT